MLFALLPLMGCRTPGLGPFLGRTYGIRRRGMNTQAAGKDARNASLSPYPPMSLETLLTLMVAGLILGLALTLRLVVLGSARLVRVLRGQPATLEQAVARVTVSERLGRILEGAAALAIFVLASLAGGVRASGRGLVALATMTGRGAVWVGGRIANWWRDAAQPSLSEAREAGIVLVTQHPETSGQLDAFAVTSPVVTSNGSSPAYAEETREMQLV